ncbi:hypothetical protein [Rehaibacterium terrae]|uniref:Uncharacterized protein n=1 Tax=Rehaibacterium terrae TaxID=1341696 RepID=A0A7W7V785_9GAMM|nr:hypothetical protein [Rehaibacterium terrae]MBB5014428.1 hypothetical protein [Rehaibacterium terrae]
MSDRATPRETRKPRCLDSASARHRRAIGVALMQRALRAALAARAGAHEVPPPRS